MHVLVDRRGLYGAEAGCKLGMWNGDWQRASLHPAGGPVTRYQYSPPSSDGVQ